ncbi:MAG: ABC transporter ATP-binding protein [Candidatus Omnitrophica bacterium]|jgi:subfamily B ATP-binding cassette protein MsbA|nr:ABC transporter ATP-binding protein [Candidatus Omnitrophota bacterium]
MKKYIKDYFKLLKFIASYKGILFLAAFFMGASTLFDGISLGMIIPISDRVLTNQEIIIPGKLPPFMSFVVDKLNSIKPLDFLTLIVIFIPILFILKGVFLFIQSYLMNIIAQGAVRNVRDKLYIKFQELSMDFYSKRRAGELMSRVTNDVGAIANSISFALKDFIFESMKALFFAFCAFYLGFKISWKLPFIVFIVFPAILVPVAKIGRKIKKFTVEIQKKMADLNSLMAETINGAGIVKAFCRETYEIERFKNINYNYYKFNLKNVKRTLSVASLTEIVGVFGVVLVLRLIGPEVISGNLSFGVFAAFIAFVMSTISPLKKLANVHAINQQAFAASERIYDILDQEPTVKDATNAKEIISFEDSIKFDRVWFEYTTEYGYVLENINLEVKKGEVVALVGRSGAGKSTLVSLLPRFYDPTKGAIYIDELDLRNIKLKSLRSMISIVSQETILFNSTIEDNIAYGKSSATKVDIIEAAKKAYAYEFIINLPEGFQTVVGDRGIRLSGGEKQRIAIARAILKNSPILILDEATSQLDSASEQLVKEALYVLMEGKTVLVIAHRLSTIQKASKIIVLNEGKIVGVGTHSNLLETNSLYKELHDLQFNV